MGRKKAAKEAKEAPKKQEAPSKTQRLVARRNIDKMLHAGWKIVEDTSERRKVLGTISHTDDLVLMEK